MAVGGAMEARQPLARHHGVEVGHRYEEQGEAEAAEGVAGGGEGLGEYMTPCSSLFSPSVFCRFGSPPYRELWHCVFKSVSMGQLVCPAYEGRFATRQEQETLFRWYQHVHFQLLQLRNNQAAAMAMASGSAAVAGAGSKASAGSTGGLPASSSK